MFDNEIYISHAFTSFLFPYFTLWNDKVMFICMNSILLCKPSPINTIMQRKPQSQMYTTTNLQTNSFYFHYSFFPHGNLYSFSQRENNFILMSFRIKTFHTNPLPYLPIDNLNQMSKNCFHFEQINVKIFNSVH